MPKDKNVPQNLPTGEPISEPEFQKPPELKKPKPEFQEPTKLLENPVPETPSRGPLIIWRFLVFGFILVVLILFAVGVVKLLPKALSSLAEVNISFSSLFSPKVKSPSTAITNYGTTATSSRVTYRIATSTPHTNYRPTTYTTSHYPVTPSYRASGPADLAVRITFIGVQNPSTGQFYTTANVSPSDRVIVRFEIQNIGNGASGPWDFQALLPTTNVADQTKYLPNQPSIPAGQAINGTLYFNNVIPGNQQIQINIDPNNRLVELRKDNNRAVANVSVSGSNYSGYSGYYGYSGYSGNGYGTVPIVSIGSDVIVRILDTGVVNQYGQYQSTNNIYSGDQAAVRFEIANQGNRSSNNFDYQIAINGSGINQNYNNQPSLSPGEAHIYTASFNNLSRGSNRVRITADSGSDTTTLYIN